MLHRARSLAVLTVLLGGAIALLSAVQPWLIARRADGAADIEVPGAEVLPLLVPLGLAVLALGAALALAGRVMRYLVGLLALVIALALGLPTLAVLREPPISAVLPTVTEITGLAGPAASALISGIAPTTWPWAALLAVLLLFIVAGGIGATAHAWPASGRRYREAEANRAAASDQTGESDAIDSWDDLSRGIDPTSQRDSTGNDRLAEGR